MFLGFFLVGLWSRLADKRHVYRYSYEAGFYKPTVLKVNLLLAGLQHMQECLVGWNIPLFFLVQTFDPNEWCLKMVSSVGGLTSH